MKHTPGPWKWHPASSVVGSLISWGDISKGETVAAAVAQKDKTVTEANARLIAAAPELLIALEHLVSQINQTQAKSSVANMALSTQEAEAALKKAGSE